MKKLWVVAGLVFGLGLMAPRVQAAEFIVPSPSQNGTISVSGEGHRNLYVAGGSVNVSSNITGDLFAAGGKILITGNVEQDLVIGGGSVTVNGNVGGDVRIGGGDVTITGQIAGDVLVGGGGVTLASTSRVGGDLIAGAGDLTVEAPVAGQVRIGGGVIYINSAISGNVWVQSDEELRFGPKAVITNPVTHKGFNEAITEEGAQISKIDFSQVERRQGQAMVGILTGAFVIKLLALILAAWLLIHFLPRRVRIVVEGVRQKPWMSLGLGFLGMIAFPVGIIILLLTFVGYYVAFIALAWFILAMLVTCLLSAIVVGAFVEKLLMKRSELKIDWQAVVIGVVISAVLCLIPVIGGLIMMVVAFMTFGSLLRMAGHQINLERQADSQS